MNRIKLNQNQGLRAGVIFLNMLGIEVDIKPVLVENNVTMYPLKLKNNQAGYMFYDEQNGQVTMEVDNDEILLSSNYMLPLVSGMKDAESGYVGIVLAQWSSNINFMIQRKSDKAVFSGNMYLDSFADKEFGAGCNIHTSIDVRNSNLGMYNLKFYNDGYNFLYHNKNEKEEQELGVSYIGDRIYHNIHWDFDENGEWQTRNIGGATSVYYGEKFRKYNATQKMVDGKIKDLEWEESMVDVANRDDEATLIQFGNVARSMMPNMLKTLKAVREDTRVGDISLLDSFIDVAFKNDELVKATFGYSPRKVVWQNGATSLKDAYFGDYSTMKQLDDKLLLK